MSDFPVPVNSIITLDHTKIYKISGVIDLITNVISSPSKIFIKGGMPCLDKLITNSTNPINELQAELLLGKDINLENTSGSILSVDGQSLSTSNIFLSNIIIENSVAFASVSNLHILELDRVTLENCHNGIIISGDNNYINFSQYNIHTPNSTLTAIQILETTSLKSFFIKNCAWEINTGQTGINIHPSVVMTNPPGRIDDIAFIGTGGTPIAGITESNPSFEFFQNVGILNSITAGSCSFSLEESISVDITTLNSWVPIQTSPPTSIYSLADNTQRFSLTNFENGELTYIGTRPHNLHISCYISISVETGNKNIAASIYINRGNGYIQCTNSVYNL